MRRCAWEKRSHDEPFFQDLASSAQVEVRADRFECHCQVFGVGVKSFEADFPLLVSLDLAFVAASRGLVKRLPRSTQT